MEGYAFLYLTSRRESGKLRGMTRSRGDIDLRYCDHGYKATSCPHCPDVGQEMLMLTVDTFFDTYMSYEDAAVIRGLGYKLGYTKKVPGTA